MSHSLHQEAAGANTAMLPQLQANENPGYLAACAASASAPSSLAACFPSIARCFFQPDAGLANPLHMIIQITLAAGLMGLFNN